MSPVLRVVVAVALLLGCCGAVQTSSPIGSIDIPHVASGPPIDGSLADPAWKQAAKVQLGYNLRDHRAAPEETTAYVLTDGAFVYVGFDARQRAPIRAVQHTNNVGQDTDDEVQVDFWPNGTSFQYAFFATPIGTHYQFCSENNSFQPTWTSAGKIVDGGFVVTMKIPLAVMHGTGSGSWRIQFARMETATNDDVVWSYGAAQQNHNDVNYAGFAGGLPPLAAAKQKPRIGVYGLGAIAAPRAGGSTSRAGVDLSVPVITGTSFVATLHPDFSNVETDQQTIAPTAFARILNETRPFFTQGANFYNATPNCTDCPGTQLYTNSIPTPREGYALEGQRGLFSYGTFDSVGYARNDTAQALNYRSPNQRDVLTFQRVAVDMPGLKDDTENVSYTHDNLTNLSEWYRYATDSGTLVADGARAQRYETGFNWYSPTSSVQFTLRKVGQYFNPYDGIIFHPDIAGYVANVNKYFNFAPHAAFKQLQINFDLQRFHGHDRGLNQASNGLYLSLTHRSNMNLQLTTGSSYLLLQNGIFAPINQQGAQLTWDFNSATPTRLSFNTGRFGPGRLNSWSRSSTMRVGERASLLVEADDTEQYMDNGARYTQWLERGAFTYSLGRDENVAFGVRRIVGYQPFLTSTAYSSAWNITFAYHRKTPLGELYAAYGDASAFSTVPQFIVKFIRYVGADKGT